MEEYKNVDVLFVGAGPASLSGAIRLKQLLKQQGYDATVVVVDKASRPGQHNLSGAVFETFVLDELIPEWKSMEHRFVKRALGNQVKTDEVVFLPDGKRKIVVPHWLVPGSLRHEGDCVISISEMVSWLVEIALQRGVEIYHGFTAVELVVEHGKVKGVRLGDKGVDKDGRPLANYVAGEVVRAKVTVLGEGSAGLLIEQLEKKIGSRRNVNPQIFSLGVKEIIRLPEKNNFGNNRVVHTMGYPLPSNMFGGGTLYSMGDNLVAVALIAALDWQYPDFNPQQELQRFKRHPFVSSMLQGGQVIAYGAKTLPEGGYYSMPDLYYDGALVIGDAAGLTSVRKLKGLHYAVKSGLVAADTLCDALIKGDFSRASLKSYHESLEKSFVIRDIKKARNYRQVFSIGGLYGGLVFSFLQEWMPFRMSIREDYQSMKKKLLRRDGTEGIDRLTAVSLSGTEHREDQPSHITFLEENPDESCFKEFGCHPCAYFCPGEVYKFENDKLVLSPSNCLHCQTCRLKCPLQLIKWDFPESGGGPKYKIM